MTPWLNQFHQYARILRETISAWGLLRMERYRSDAPTTDRPIRVKVLSSTTSITPNPKTEILIGYTAKP